MMKVTIAVTAVFMLLLGFMFHKYTVEVEARVKYEVAAQGEKLAREYMEKTAQKSQDQANEIYAKNAEIALITQQTTREINELRGHYEDQLRQEPFDTGNDFERRLAHSMCKIASSNNEDRKACDIQATRPYSPDKSLVITVTADTAEQWREQCEEGLTDYCDYAIVGLTVQGSLTILDWVNQVDKYTSELMNKNYYNEQIIDILMEHEQ